MTVQRRLGIVAGLAAIAAIAVLASRGRGGGDVIVASGTVEATEIDLGFSTPGTIEHIAAREGDRVIQGTELARLDRSELLARRRAAAAREASARARLTELSAGFREEEVAQGRANLRAAEQQLTEARRVRDRTRRLFDGGAVSREQLDRQETAFELAQAQFETAKEQLEILEAGPRSETIQAQRAVVAQVEAQVAQIDALLDKTVIRAPITGVVSVRHREPGEIVGAGTPVLTLRNPDDRWVRIYVREDEVGRISVGQRATIAADAYPERTYGGRVVFIADEAEFTPRNVQTTEERVKLVYRVKVAITDDPSYDLKPGLPADVRIAPPGR